MTHKQFNSPFDFRQSLESSGKSIKLLEQDKKVSMGRAIDYKEHLMNLLKDPEEAAAYLNAMLDDDDKEGFLLALRDVAEAQGGLSRLA